MHVTIDAGPHKLVLQTSPHTDLFAPEVTFEARGKVRECLCHVARAIQPFARSFFDGSDMLEHGTLMPMLQFTVPGSVRSRPSSDIRL